MASLSGLEQAVKTKNELWKQMALSRMKMIYAVLFALPRIPLLYAGDELAMFNDYSYKNVESKKQDSRWVHRIEKEKYNLKLSKKEDGYNERKEFAVFIKNVLSKNYLWW